MTDDLRVCFVGDSFVAGVGDPRHLGWAGRLAAGSHRAGRPLTAYNLGVRRDTSADVAGRWRAECRSRLPEGADCRVVVSFGVNDATVDDDGRPRVAAGRSAAHLDAMLAGAERARWAALVVGPPPVADRAHNERTAVLDEGFAGVCAARGVGYVRVLPALLDEPAWMDEVAVGDGAHPAAAGYDALARLVRPHWQAWLANGSLRRAGAPTGAPLGS
ncbi:UNVERIFIED_ORG: G-D-S-L family lipolytic protein [Bacillus sp. AZ43]